MPLFWPVVVVAGIGFKAVYWDGAAKPFEDKTACEQMLDEIRQQAEQTAGFIKALKEANETNAGLKWSQLCVNVPPAEYQESLGPDDDGDDL